MKTEFILESGSGNLNEDALVVENNLFGVFDGATSLDDKTYDQGKTGGGIASSIASSVFSKNCYPLVQLAKGANKKIHNKMVFHGVDLSKKENLWSTSSAVIRIKDNEIEWVQTGDCSIILIFKDNSYKVLVEQDDHDHETLEMWKKEAEKGSVAIREILKDQIKKVRSGMNRDYGVLNGEEEANHFLKHGYEPLDNVKEIILFTDGLSVPRKKPLKSRCYKDLVSLYRTLGLNGLKSRIRSMEKEDPHCTLYPRFKCHDDIAAIAIKI